MKLIVGLGNPGPKFEGSRHNIGFMVVDRLARELGPATIEWREDPKYKSWIAKTGDVMLVKPVTFMNNAGLAVVALQRFYKLETADIWIVHDDIDLPLGKIRIRRGGASAGHHGVESAITQLRSADFWRFRLGVGRGKEDKRLSTDRRLGHERLIRFVLSRFSRSEAGELKHLVKRGAQAVRIALVDGIDRAMNRFN